MQLSWRNERAFVYDRTTFEPIQTITLAGREGWGLTSDGRWLIASDGTATLRYLDPETLQTTRTLQATLHGAPLERLNELEWVEGEIWANVWQTELIARIDPATGAVKSWLDAALLPRTGAPDAPVDVFNGIAWDPQGRRLFVTGKLWPKLYEVRVQH